MRKTPAELLRRQNELLYYERLYQAQGYTRIAGVDEAGRGPLAGPLVVAAVVLPAECELYGVDDSKKISEKNRERLYDTVLAQAVAYSVRIIAPETIDEINIYQATLRGMAECLDELAPQVALIDAMPLQSQSYLPVSLIKGDSLSLSIAAASIIAKVTRDRIMYELAAQYPEYGLGKHKGYPTKAHIEAIRTYGITPCHRLSYEPIKTLISSS